MHGHLPDDDGMFREEIHKWGKLTNGVLAKEVEKPFAEDKQIPSVGYLMRYFAFGRHLEEIHVTWALFDKKHTRATDLHHHCTEFPLQKLETASQITRDAVTVKTKTASQDLTTAS
ncbi:hypothetical protein Tco_0658471 [Tanacetum coccineum]